MQRLQLGNPRVAAPHTVKLGKQSVVLPARNEVRMLKVGVFLVVGVLSSSYNSTALVLYQIVAFGAVLLSSQ